MKKILITILLFVAFVKVADIVCYHLLCKIYENTYAGQEGGDLNKYLHDAQPPSLVLMGSSITKMQVCPDSFSVPSCNLGRAGTKESYQLGLLSLMIKRNKIPKCILLGIKPKSYTITQDEDVKGEDEDVLLLKYYYNEVPFVENEINKISIFEKCKFLFSCTKFNGYVMHTIKNYCRTIKEKNNKYFFKYLAVNPIDSLNIIAYKKSHPPLKVTEPLPVSAKDASYLPAFIDTCKKYGIKLVCFTSPSLNYRSDSIRLANAYEYVQHTLKGKDIPYIMFTPNNSPEFYSRLGYWSDGSHLNEIGSSILSAKLAKFTEANYSNPALCFRQP